jgi:hypothetical protein
MRNKNACGFILPPQLHHAKARSSELSVSAVSGVSTWYALLFAAPFCGHIQLLLSKRGGGIITDNKAPLRPQRSADFFVERELLRFSKMVQHMAVIFLGASVKKLVHKLKPWAGFIHNSPLTFVSF